jgi:hypothetical protein
VDIQARQKIEELEARIKKLEYCSHRWGRQLYFTMSGTGYYICEKCDEKDFVR